MILKILVLPDVHLSEEKPTKPYLLVKQFLKDYKPHETILLGDFMDCTALSHWNENRRLLMEGKRYLNEVGIANAELDYIQKYSKKVTYLCGNHEDWSYQYIERFPELRGMIETHIRLELIERDIAWIKLNDLYKVGKLNFTHGIYCNKYHAQAHLQAFGCSVVYGHTHRAQSAQLCMKMQEPIMAWGLGCLCSHAPDYLKNRPSSWIDQFGISEIDSDSGRFNFYPVNITDGQFIYAERIYR